MAKSNFAKRLFVSTSLIGGAVLAQAVAPAMAQLDQIVVTAQSRAKGLQDTPISITALPAEKLAETGIQKAEDLQFLVPNFTMTETGIATNLFIRGIGSGINQAFEQSVATYIDGVHYPRAQQTRSPFLDLERVEVLRGPQAILFGKNAVAGALNITTAKPTDEFEGYFLALMNSWTRNMCLKVQFLVRLRIVSAQDCLVVIAMPMAMSKI